MKIGDLVRLKSGGPIMTVTYVQGDNITVAWISSVRTEREVFPKGTLVPVSPDLPAMQTQHGTAALDPLWAAHVSF